MYPVKIQIITLHLITSLSLFGCIAHQRISYQKDVVPIIDANCIKCHNPVNGTGYQKTGLDLTSYASLMKGSVYGQVIRPGNSRNSILNILVEGRADKTLRMPHDTDQSLQQGDIETLRLWVDQGAKNN